MCSKVLDVLGRKKATHDTYPAYAVLMEITGYAAHANSAHIQLDHPNSLQSVDEHEHVLHGAHGMLLPRGYSVLLTPRMPISPQLMA